MSNDKTRDLFRDGFTSEDFAVIGGWHVERSHAQNTANRANQLLRAALAEAQVVYEHLEPGIWMDTPYEETTLSKHTARLVAISEITPRTGEEK